MKPETRMEMAVAYPAKMSDIADCVPFYCLAIGDTVGHGERVHKIRVARERTFLGCGRLELKVGVGVSVWCRFFDFVPVF